mmetsp:Transcript_69708/g.192766  ORF Transcript_69708/g.192766 Transcript_69708/m.192766 type:complete len:426 (-) Transcript_69708:111-1388(-)
MTAAQSHDRQQPYQDGAHHVVAEAEAAAVALRLNSDNAFNLQVSLASEVSHASRTSTNSGTEDSSFHHYSRQCTELDHQSGEINRQSSGITRQCTDIDRMVSIVVNEVLVKKAIRAAVRECKFCVTIANPKGYDFPLIAVSEEFETMTGFKRNEILGVNCRFLNQGCDMDPEMLMGLRLASQTGAPFTALLPNRKKSGELFLNLLDLRGLTVAQHSGTGEDLWFLIGIQADVTGLADDEVPEDHLAELQVLADGIRAGIMKELSEMAVIGASQSSAELPELGKSIGQWHLLKEPKWRPGAPLGQRQPRDPAALDLANYTGSTSSPMESSLRTEMVRQVPPDPHVEFRPNSAGHEVSSTACTTRLEATTGNTHGVHLRACGEPCRGQPWTWSPSNTHKDTLLWTLGASALAAALLVSVHQRARRYL